MGPSLQLGARVAWQGELSAKALLEEKRSIVVSCRPLWEKLAGLDARVIVLEPRFWTPFDRSPPYFPLLYPFPAGTPENRWSRRRRRELVFETARRDHATFLQLAAGGHATREHVFLARHTGPGQVRIEASP